MSRFLQNFLLSLAAIALFAVAGAATALLGLWHWWAGVIFGVVVVAAVMALGEEGNG